MTSLADNLRDNLLDRLDAAYPSFNGLWRAEVDPVGGIVQVTNLLLSGRWGFIMKINSIDSEGRKVVLAGGELLERYRVSRAKMVDLSDVVAMPLDRRGELMVDKG